MKFEVSLRLKALEILTGLPGLQESRRNSRVVALTSKGRAAKIFSESFRWMDSTNSLFIKIEEQHGNVIPSFQHSGFYFPPGRPLWQSADDQMVQTIRLQTEHISMLSLIHT